MRCRSLAVFLMRAVATSANADASADDEEFVEPYNTTGTPVVIGNRQLGAYSGETGLSDFTKAIPAANASDWTMISE